MYHCWIFQWTYYLKCCQCQHTQEHIDKITDVFLSVHMYLHADTYICMHASIDMFVYIFTYSSSHLYPYKIFLQIYHTSIMFVKCLNTDFFFFNGHFPTAYAWTIICQLSACARMDIEGCTSMHKCMQIQITQCFTACLIIKNPQWKKINCAWQSFEKISAKWIIAISIPTSCPWIVTFKKKFEQNFVLKWQLNHYHFDYWVGTI